MSSKMKEIDGNSSQMSPFLMATAFKIHSTTQDYRFFTTKHDIIIL